MRLLQLIALSLTVGTPRLQQGSLGVTLDSFLDGRAVVEAATRFPTSDRLARNALQRWLDVRLETFLDQSVPAQRAFLVELVQAEAAHPWAPTFESLASSDAEISARRRLLAWAEGARHELVASYHSAAVAKMEVTAVLGASLRIGPTGEELYDGSLCRRWIEYLRVGHGLDGDALDAVLYEGLGDELLAYRSRAEAFDPDDRLELVMALKRSRLTAQAPLDDRAVTFQEAADELLHILASSLCDPPPPHVTPATQRMLIELDPRTFEARSLVRWRFVHRRQLGELVGDIPATSVVELARAMRTNVVHATGEASEARLARLAIWVCVDAGVFIAADARRLMADAHLLAQHVASPEARALRAAVERLRIQIIPLPKSTDEDR